MRQFTLFSTKLLGIAYSLQVVAMSEDGNRVKYKRFGFNSHSEADVTAVLDGIAHLVSRAGPHGEVLVVLGLRSNAQWVYLNHRIVKLLSDLDLDMVVWSMRGFRLKHLSPLSGTLGLYSTFTQYTADYFLPDLDRHERRRRLDMVEQSSSSISDLLPVINKHVEKTQAIAYQYKDLYTSMISGSVYSLKLDSKSAQFLAKHEIAMTIDLT